MSIKSLRKNQSGFTIVELLIVIVIIGILAALVFVQFNNSQAKARDAERKADLRQLSGKLAEYNAEKGTYPAGGVSGLCGTPGKLGGTPEKTCADPMNTGSHVYTYTPSPSGCDETTTQCTSYELNVALEKSNVAAENAANGYKVTSD